MIGVGGLVGKWSVDWWVSGKWSVGRCSVGLWSVVLTKPVCPRAPAIKSLVVMVMTRRHVILRQDVRVHRINIKVFSELSQVSFVPYDKHPSLSVGFYQNHQPPTQGSLSTYPPTHWSLYRRPTDTSPLI